MERTRKSSEEEQNNVDRLSDLPDCIISHILSFIPTKLSLSTSVLAKRWRFLWAHTPLLDFNSWYLDSQQEMSFTSIVCTVTLRHKAQSLNTFRLAFGYSFGDRPDGCNAYELQTCIATVVDRNIRVLYLDHRIEVPCCLLTCKTLVDLTMRLDVSIPPSAPISFPNLKKLNLYYLKCEVDFPRLLSGCPVLEDLFIEETKCRDPRGCFISLPTLKRLTIIRLLDIGMLEYPDYMVTINCTPALRYLKVVDCSCKHISILPCTSLVEADISIDSLCERDEFYPRCVLKLLDSICNVKSLKLTGSCDKICDEKMLGSIAKFRNLIKLELYAPWCLLTKVLKTSDHLQFLTIIEDDSDSKHNVRANYILLGL